MKDEPLEQVNNFRVASKRTAGAICSVGGRFIAWRRRVKKRTRKLDDMHDARVEAARANWGLAAGSESWIGAAAVL